MGFAAISTDLYFWLISPHRFIAAELTAPQISAMAERWGDGLI